MSNYAQVTSRNENLRTLIAALRHGELTQDEIADLFKCSRSGVRAYLKCLGSLVEAITHGSILAPRTYRLTTDQAAIDAFLASLVVVRKAPLRIRDRRQPVDPTRHIHIMDDDAPFRVPVCHVMPQHPAIHAVFWGVGA